MVFVSVKLEQHSSIEILANLFIINLLSVLINVIEVVIILMIHMME